MLGELPPLLTDKEIWSYVDGEPIKADLPLRAWQAIELSVMRDVAQALANVHIKVRLVKDPNIGPTVYCQEVPSLSICLLERKVDKVVISFLVPKSYKTCVQVMEIKGDLSQITRYVQDIIRIHSPRQI